MTHRRSELGAAGEAAACTYLERLGYRILARNARAERVEIDIVAERGGVLVFLEVKTRSGTGYGTGADAVDARKQARIARGAAAWLRESGRQPRRVRFDVITCQAEGGGGFRMTHWESAFEAGN